MESFDEILKQWKDAVGAEVFASAQPSQTLRARSSWRKSAEATHVQTSAPGGEADATLLQTTAPGERPTTFIPHGATFANAAEFRFGSIVGEGGMGQIFSAEQRGLRRDVAIKQIHPDSEAMGIE